MSLLHRNKHGQIIMRDRLSGTIGFLKDQPVKQELDREYEEVSTLIDLSTETDCVVWEKDQGTQDPDLPVK